MKKANILFYQVEEITAPLFRAINDDYIITFESEYKSGVYSKIKSVYNKKNNRAYTAQRYFYKFIGEIQTISNSMLRRGWLWDYKNNVPALQTYKKDIAPYYYKCKAAGLPVYKDQRFLEVLFKEGDNR